MNYNDLAIFNYGGVGAAATPMVTGMPTNAVNAYLQSPSTGTQSQPQSLAQNTGTNGFFDSTGKLGFNVDTTKLVLGGLGTIGSLWQAWEANKLAKEQFRFQKEITNTNLTNQIQAYNTALEDRTRSRAHTESMSQQDAQAYIDANRMRRQ